MKKKSLKRVFISYARQDYAKAERIQKHLERNGQLTWLDKTDVHAGELWEKDVRDVIKDSVFFIALLSQGSVAHTDGFVWVEFRLALRLYRESGLTKPHIIPVRLDQVEIPEEFTQFHCLDFSTVTLEDILFRIENHLEEEKDKRPVVVVAPPKPEKSLMKRRLVALSFGLITLLGLVVFINWPWRSKLLFKATVFDSATNQPITGAYAYLLGPKDDTIIRSPRSGNNGQVSFVLDTTGEIQTTIWYTHPKYKTFSKPIRLMAHDTYRSVRLAKKPGSDSSTKPLQPSDKSQGPG